MATEFIFKGQSLTLATEDELRAAVMLGKLVSREDGIATYSYQGRLYLASDRDLEDLKPGEPR